MLIKYVNISIILFGGLLMLVSTFNGISIDAIACAVPKQEETSEKIYKKHGQEYTEKIKKTIAVNTIRKSIKKQISSDLGFIAAQKILNYKNINPTDIGIMVYVTQTPDYQIPATSCILHKRLGLSIDCATIDVNNGCAGFVYGTHVICSMLNSINCNYALLINGDTSSPKKIIKECLKKRISVPFGDGTTAVLFKKSNINDLIQITLRTNGNGYHSLILYGGGGYRVKTYTTKEKKVGYKNINYPLMNGIDVFNFTITDVPTQVNEFLSYQNMSISDYDCIVLHQPNLYMIKQIAKKINADMEKIPISLYKYGNTSGASIPLTLVDKYGDTNNGIVKTLMCGFGVGLYWGTMSVNINTSDILPMIYSDDYFIDPQIDNYVYD